MEKKNIKPIIELIAAVLLIMLFGYAVITKIQDQHRFILQMELAPVPIIRELAPLLGWLMPLLMGGIVALLVIGILFSERLLRMGFLVSFVLLLVLDVYVASMLLSGKELPCTCGGLHEQLQWREHLLINAAFMIVSLLPILLNICRVRKRE